MLSKEDVLKAVADAWWERSPKILEFVNKYLSVEEDFYSRAYLLRRAFSALVRKRYRELSSH